MDDILGGSDEQVFRALADPTRRLLLDALFASDGQTLGALCERCPDLTRFGVMKHLGVLEKADLVVTVRQGRTKLHFLNPVPIARIAERWIGKYAAPFAGALLDLDEVAQQIPEQQQIPDQRSI